MALDVLILNPKKILFEGKAKSVRLPGESGVFELLSFHKPILSRLVSGVLFVDDMAFPIKRGIAKMRSNKATVIVEE
jgi:F-type H+-transporting ATPase subunit epsilon